ncbi:MAG: DUF362 domain-containing protein, partial [Kiritimatiellae bacterium]|nr:DUF362 domain-containing protein [Kiritimatiellia bacterium]
GIGYSTIHPLFVKILVDHVRSGKPRRVFITDADISGAKERGYAKQTVGADVVSTLGKNGRAVLKKSTGWKHVPTVLLSKPVTEADVLINFAHVKGHGACGFGGACKNLAMGCVPNKTRAKLHSLEGDLKWNKEKCIRCNKCLRECAMKANKFNKSGAYEIFWHNCKMCMHCMLACPTGAIKIQNRNFYLFQEGLARVAKLVLDSFEPDNMFHINVLTNITIFCDCWGFTTPTLVPDIGVFGSQDIVAVDHASLMAIKTENLIRGSLTPPYVLEKRGHLFERIHHKNPFVQVNALRRLGAGSTDYTVIEVK